MTYKPTKFDESAVMRSLEKIAIQKGLATPDQIQKKAEAKETVPTESFSENLLVLCGKLRSRGFNKYADELEVKFLTFKKAETSLYDITKETGEDLIDTAHPDGSKKLDSSWDELGEVETITEQHSKILDVIKKMPKGKLASKNAINAVKVVMSQHLANGITEEEQRNDLARKYLGDANKVLDKITDIVNREGGLWNAGISPTVLFTRGKLFNNKVKEIKGILAKNEPTIDDVSAVMKILNTIHSEISPGITGGVNENTWSLVNPMFTEFNGPLNKALDQIKQRNTLRVQRLSGEAPQAKPESKEQAGNVITIPEVEQQASTPESVALAKLQDKLQSMVNQLKAYITVKTVRQNPAAVKWLQDEGLDLKEIYDNIEKNIDNPEQAKAILQSVQAEIAEEEANIKDFYADWVQPKGGV